MGGGRLYCKGVISLRWHALLRPMHASRAHAARKSAVGRDQQNHAARTADGGKLARDSGAIIGAKMPINDGRTARQAFGGRDGIGRSQRVGEEIQRRNAARACLAVEPLRLRR